MSISESEGLTSKVEAEEKSVVTIRVNVEELQGVNQNVTD